MKTFSKKLFNMHPITLLKLVTLGSVAFTFISTLHVLYSSDK